jgi:hypothetical protein
LTSPAVRPQWNTGALWGVLAVLLVFGAVGCATCVYGVTLLFAGLWVGVGVAGAGAIGAFLAFLFTAGILYRVDRYRGALAGRVDFFE